MAIATNNLEKKAREFGLNWGWLLGLGILLVVMGLVGLGLVAWLTIVSIFFFGAFLIIAGIANFFYLFKDKKWKWLIWHALMAICYIIAGGIIIYDPILASTIITTFLAFLFIFMGITRLFMAISFRWSSGLGWLILAGIAGVVLGVIVLAQWPISSLWFIGLLIAIEMMMTGWSLVFIALELKKNLLK